MCASRRSESYTDTSLTCITDLLTHINVNIHVNPHRSVRSRGRVVSPTRWSHRTTVVGRPRAMGRARRRARARAIVAALAIGACALVVLAGMFATVATSDGSRDGFTVTDDATTTTTVDSRDVETRETAGVDVETNVDAVEGRSGDGSTTTRTTTLKDLLSRGGEDEGACTGAEARGKFYPASEALILEIEHRIKSRIGFGWARWGDAEMAASARDGSAMRLVARALVSKSATPNCVLNVGVHWLCNPGLRMQWNAAAEGIDQEDTASHSFFFLPMGDPADDDREKWRAKGIRGYVDVIKESERKIILLGPPHVAKLPFLSDATFIDASGSGGAGDHAADDVVAKLFEIGDAMKDPPIVIMAAGMAAKTAIVSGQDRINDRGWGFIDAGTTLDGYAGKHSRDYNDPKKYCEKTKSRARRPGDGIERWTAPGVCAGLGIV